MKLARSIPLLALVGTPAYAATFSPPTAVPALDGWGLMAMSVVLAVFAVRHLKSRK